MSSPDLEFLLRSLDDLDAERSAGNVDDETYRVLHDDYTARAAAAIRAARADAPVVVPEPAPAPRGLRLLTVAAIVVFAVGAAYALTRAVGTREPGGTITGNDQTETAERVDTLRAAAEAAPDSYDARIAYARALLGNDLAAASREYVAARELDPTQPEPPAYIGWIAAQAGGQLGGARGDAVLADAVSWLDQAIALDETYPDAYVYRGLVKFNYLGDAAGAVPDFQMFLALAPEHPMREMVTDVLARAVAQSPTSTTGGP